MDKVLKKNIITKIAILCVAIVLLAGVCVLSLFNTNTVSASAYSYPVTEDLGYGTWQGIPDEYSRVSYVDNFNVAVEGTSYRLKFDRNADFVTYDRAVEIQVLIAKPDLGGYFVQEGRSLLYKGNSFIFGTSPGLYINDYMRSANISPGTYHVGVYFFRHDNQTYTSTSPTSISFDYDPYDINENYKMYIPSNLSDDKVTINGYWGEYEVDNDVTKVGLYYYRQTVPGRDGLPSNIHYSSLGALSFNREDVLAVLDDNVGWQLLHEVDNDGSVDFSNLNFTENDSFASNLMNVGHYWLTFILFYDNPDKIGYSFPKDIEREGEIALPPAPTKEGHTFVGWYYDEALTDKYIEGHYIYEDTTLYAKFEAISYWVNFYAFGAHIGSEEVYYGELLDVAVLTEIDAEARADIEDMTGKNLDYYVYDGLYLDAECTIKYTADSPVTDHLNLYLNFRENFCTVTFIVNGAVYAEVIVPYGYGLVSIEEAGPLMADFSSVSTNPLMLGVFDVEQPITENLTLFADLKGSTDSISAFVTNNWRYLAGAAGLVLLAVVIASLITGRKKRRRRR